MVLALVAMMMKSMLSMMSVISVMSLINMMMFQAMVMPVMENNDSKHRHRSSAEERLETSP
jgi:hypothetical protein